MTHDQSTRGGGSDDLPVGRLTRRDVLRTGFVAAGVSVAGCSGGGGSTDDGNSDGSGTDGGSSDGETSTGTPTGGDGDAARPPGADVVGGPDDLQSRVDVDATVLETDQGAGTHVFTPAVAWVETGGTVVWHFEETSHTVTTYHPNYDRPQRIPSGVETPFNSEFGGAGDPGTSFNFVFETPGVWNYFCKPHEGQGMVGIVVVEGPEGGPGLSKPDGLEHEAAADKLTRLLEDGAFTG